MANHCRSRNTGSFLVESLLLKQDEKVRSIDTSPFSGMSPVFSDKLRSLVYDAGLAAMKVKSRETASGAAGSKSITSDGHQATTTTLITNMVAQQDVDLADGSKYSHREPSTSPSLRQLPFSELIPWPSVQPKLGTHPPLCWCHNAPGCFSHQSTPNYHNMFPPVTRFPSQCRSPWLESLIARHQSIVAATSLNQPQWSTSLPVSPFSNIDLHKPVDVSPTSSLDDSHRNTTSRQAHSTKPQLLTAISPSSSLSCRNVDCRYLSPSSEYTFDNDSLHFM